MSDLDNKAQNIQPSIQNRRYPHALEDNYTQVDIQSFEHQLKYAEKVSRVLKFYREDLQQQGQWNVLFHNSLLNLLADIQLFFPGYSNVAENIKHANKVQKQGRLLFYIMQMINTWINRCQWCEHQTTAHIKTTLFETVNNSLRTELHTLGSLLPHFENSDTIETLYDFSGFADVWEIDSNQGTFALAKDLVPELTDVAAVIQHLLQSSYGQLAYLREQGKFLTKHALSKQGHHPTLSLFFTFLKLCERLQGLINDYGTKHRDHYYLDILKLDLAKPKTDRVVLKLPLKPSVNQLDLPENIIFHHLQDKAHDIDFVQPSGAHLHDAEVAMLKTICKERDEYISPECLLGFVTRIKQSDMSAAQMQANSVRNLTMFGKGEFRHNDVYPSNTIDVGFAIASPSFLLAKGTRTITLTLQLQDELENNTRLISLLQKQSEALLESLPICFELVFTALNISADISSLQIFNNVSADLHNNFAQMAIDQRLSNIKKHALLCLLQTTKDNKVAHRAIGKLICHNILCNAGWLCQQDLEQFDRIMEQRKDLHLFASSREIATIKDYLHNNNRHRYSALLANLFNVHLTGQQGWENILNVKLAASKTTNNYPVITLTSRISSKIGAIVGCDPDLHLVGHPSLLPVMKVTLNTSSNLYGHSLFADMVLQHLTINTHVSEDNNLIAFNEFGRLDTTKPFMPFGPIPKLKSYVLIGHSEAARKKITAFSINIKWSGLPDSQGGFGTLYNEYGLDVNNLSYQVCTSTLINNDWKVTGQMPLFSNQDNTQLLSQYSTISFLDNLSTTPISAKKVSDFADYHNQSNGYCALQLVAPSFAFGHAQYPTVMTNNLSQSLKLKKKIVLPPAPITPVIERIQANYSSVEEISLLGSQQQITQHTHLLHVFGDSLEPMKKINRRGGADLLPKFNHDGNLYVGFRAERAPYELSLFFELGEDATLTIDGQLKPISWEAYTDQGWVTLPQANLLSDTTDNLTVSGIVVIALPENITINSYQSPKQLYWIRISTSYASQHYPTIKRVLSNCVEVIGTGRESDSSLLDQEFSSSPFISDFGTAKAVAHFQSRKASKDDRQTIISTNEFLRHKGSPITAWDYERIILEAFPEVYLVKCFPHSASVSPRKTPGRILLMVLPYLPEGTDYTNGVKANSNLLNRIHHFIKQKCQPGIRIEVSSPRYERIQVRCQVSFSAKRGSGRYISQLNQAICDYFNPWQEYASRNGFGWQLSCTEMEAFIQNLSFVNQVTGLSIIHISEKRSYFYTLCDSANTPKSSITKISSLYPWCLPLADKQHHIEVVEDLEAASPVPIGINDMEIGNNFILGA